MDELTRFVRQLAERLALRPEGGERPVTVAAIREQLLPYRAERRALGLASVEDYETVLLRLVAEERGYVRTSPAAAAERCREELAQSNPDLGVLEEIADSTIQVTSLAAGRTEIPIHPPAAGTRARDDDQGGHPEPVAPRSHPEPAKPARDLPAAAEGSHCRHCRNQLPSGRTATFCPWCGERLIPLSCSRCGSELASGWRHCITCGSPVQDPLRTS